MSGRSKSSKGCVLSSTCCFYGWYLNLNLETRTGVKIVRAIYQCLVSRVT
jgi:hypothetical protein